MPSTLERHDPWDPALIYVIGHQRPDTDAIASSMGYAWFLRETGTPNATAARCGQPGEQAQFALKRFGMNPPRLLTGVAPTFGHAARPQSSVEPDEPLPAAMARLAEGARVIPVVDGNCQPMGIITPLALARAYTAPMNLLEMMAQHCQSIAEPPSAFSSLDRISDHRSVLLRSEIDDFVVVDDDGCYVGVATRRNILEPPRAKLILVDHNELTQAVPGADEADIIAVLDHHRLGNATTAAPIPFVVEPVGSTSTLVAEKCRSYALTPESGLAGMLLSGILSDTLIFRSPTATDRDRTVAHWLAEIAGLDLQSYGEELLRAAPGLTARKAEEIIDADRKSYQMGGYSVSIAQVEVGGLQEVAERRDELIKVMEQRRVSEGHALLCMMITDVVAERSLLLCTGDTRLLAVLPFDRLAEKEFDLEDMVSRKKQLVPTLHAALEESL